MDVRHTVIPGLEGFMQSPRHTAEILGFFGGAALLQLVFVGTLRLNSTWLRIVLAVGVILLASPVLAKILRTYGENGLPAGQFSWSTQSWMFMLDTWALAPAAGFIALAWRRPEVRESWLVNTWWWLPLCMVLGFLLIHDNGRGSGGSRDR